MSRIMGRAVTSISVIADTSGTTSRARLAAHGDEVPDSVFVKMAAQTGATRLMGELGRLGETEVQFYRQLSAELAGAVPAAYGSSFDGPTGRFVLVLQDLADGQCQFPDTLHPFTKDQAALVVELLARLHGTFWGRVDSGRFGWLYSGSDDPSVPLVPTMLRTSARRLATRTPIPVADGEFIIQHYPAVARLIDTPPHTVLHGDAHRGNCYFRGAGQNVSAGLLAWQAVRCGHPARDLAYTLITSMSTADRQRCERELLDTYRRALAAAGGPDLQRDELWRRYRQAAAYAYVATTIVAGLGGMQSADIALAGLELAVAAVHDLDTVAALQGPDLGGTS